MDRAPCLARGQCVSGHVVRAERGSEEGPSEPGPSEQEDWTLPLLVVCHVLGVNLGVIKKTVQKWRGVNESQRLSKGTTSTRVIMASAHLRIHWQSSRKAHLDPFQTFLERLSQEIEEEQLESLKFLLEKHIPASTLEKCTTPRKLFKSLKQNGLLGYNNLDFLEELLKVARRSDLVEIVKDFKRQPTMEFDSGYPGNYGIIDYVYVVDFVVVHICF